MLRGLRRRFGATRGEPLASLTVLVIAVSPYPEEPLEIEEYRPALIVQSAPEPTEASLTPAQVAITTLLGVEWAQERLADGRLPARLATIVPHLRRALVNGRLGPEQYAQHRLGQRERYFNHRDAAAYEIALHDNEHGPFVVVRDRVLKGRWDEAATLLEAASVAPYEALLRLDREVGLAMLDWLELATKRWLDGAPARFPTATWSVDDRFLPPAAPDQG